MGAKTAKLRRHQLDRFFHQSESVLTTKIPKYGWVKEIREALGMTMQDLGTRLGVIKQRIERIEKDEVAGKVTLQTLRDTAEALDCELVYFLVPKGQGLQKLLETQALKAAREIVKDTEHTMGLEEQDTSRQSQQHLVESVAAELLLKEDRKIWRSQHENSKSSRGHSSRR
ncbi:mobile mystery protein A [Bdellovibrio sp. ArHS]|uniref:mobile mystery protein A n=1 Tax=Bdellovibrio sp. ArHS TaxID=1569284 RepID=UPI000AB63929|nr:mobile mystery protein A [Bdellovibrio sp. ArHS]